RDCRFGTSPASTPAGAVTQYVEIGNIRGSSRRRGRTNQQKIAQSLAVLLVANQLSHVFAAGSIAALSNLLLRKRLEGVRQRNIHCTHEENKLCGLAKFGEVSPRGRRRAAGGHTFPPISDTSTASSWRSDWSHRFSLSRPVDGIVPEPRAQHLHGQSAGAYRAAHDRARGAGSLRSGRFRVEHAR